MWTLAAEWASLESLASHASSQDLLELQSLPSAMGGAGFFTAGISLGIVAPALHLGSLGLHSAFDLPAAFSLQAYLQPSAALSTTLSLPIPGRSDLASLALTFAHARLWTAGFCEYGHQASVWFSKYAVNSQFLLSIDPALVLAELAILLGVGARLCQVLGLAKQTQLFYDDLVTFCKQNGVSVTEVFSLLSVALGLLVFDIFFAFVDEDPADVISYGILLFIFATVASLLLALDIFFYFMVSGVGSASSTLRAVGTDVVNNGLCLLRVFFCWTRYIFYDLQTELVDFTLQYTDTVNEGLPVALGFAASADWSGLGLSAAVGFWPTLSLLTFSLLSVFADVVLMVAQLLMGFFKLAIALFLLWLIVDLFLLRALALSESIGLFVLRQRRV